jgi:hypothetical protein
MEQLAIHNPCDIPSVLPDRMVLQIHWYREPNFQKFLRSNDFKIVVIARHPLDVLISVLRFLKYEPLTARWLEGNTELPPELCHHPPASQAFLAYATSWGAENLLSVSYQWWHDPSAIKVRYENLVQEPVGSFTDLVQQLSQSAGKVALAVNENSLKVLQETPNRHGWQGTPGLWRKVVPPFDALRILHRHRRVFTVLDYSVSPYLLFRATAIRNWQRLTV